MNEAAVRWADITANPIRLTNADFYVGPTSETAGQHQIGIGLPYRVC